MSRRTVPSTKIKRSMEVWILISEQTKLSKRLHYLHDQISRDPNIIFALLRLTNPYLKQTLHLSPQKKSIQKSSRAVNPTKSSLKTTEAPDNDDKLSWNINKQNVVRKENDVTTTTTTTVWKALRIFSQIPLNPKHDNDKNQQQNHRQP